jgi:hypothetical protein
LVERFYVPLSRNQEEASTDWLKSLFLFSKMKKLRKLDKI